MTASLAPTWPLTLLIPFVFAAGCARDPSGARDEASRIVRAVDGLIAADRRAKARPLAALEAQPCAEPRVCALKARCTDAFRPLVESSTLAAEVASAVDAGLGTLGPDQRLELFAKTDRADRAKLEAEARLDACVSASAEVRQAFKL